MAILRLDRLGPAAAALLRVLGGHSTSRGAAPSGSAARAWCWTPSAAPRAS